MSASKKQKLDPAAWRELTGDPATWPEQRTTVETLHGVGDRPFLAHWDIARSYWTGGGADAGARWTRAWFAEEAGHGLMNPPLAWRPVQQHPERSDFPNATRNLLRVRSDHSSGIFPDLIDARYREKSKQ